RLFPKFGLVCAAVALAAGCAAPRPAPVSDRTPQSRPAPSAQAAARPAAKPVETRPEFYTVKKGDTLYSIALDPGLDYRELAQWNGIGDPGAIRIGQQLRLRAPGATAVTTAPAKGTTNVQGRPLGETPAPAAGDNVKTQPKAVRAPYSDQTYAQM